MASGKRYIGTIEAGAGVVHVNNVPLLPRYDLQNHSPDGFAWGYSGSGSAQLALALCCDVLQDDERAQAIYHEFMRVYVAGLDGARSWFAWGDDLLRIIEKWERARRAHPPRNPLLAKRFARG